MNEGKDRETVKILTDGEKIMLLTQHEGWGLVRTKLVDKIIDLQSINNLDPATTPEQLAIDVKARRMAVQIMFEWLKGDVEGSVEQHINNTQLANEKETYIVREE